MKKTKEAYNKALQSLDLLVMQTRKAHDEAVDRFDAAKAENIKWSRPVSEYDYPGRAAQARAKADFEECKSETFSTVTDEWKSRVFLSAVAKAYTSMAALSTAKRV